MYITSVYVAHTLYIHIPIELLYIKILKFIPNNQVESIDQQAQVYKSGHPLPSIWPIINYLICLGIILLQDINNKFHPRARMSLALWTHGHPGT